jgi:ankyrin repeat protein
MTYDPARLKEWVNTATLPSTEASKEFNFAKESDSVDLDVGFTPLHYAAYHGNPKTIDLLIAAGAD